MGPRQSVESVVSVANSVLQQQVTDILTNNTTRISNVIDARQEITFINNGTVKCGTFDITQNLTATNKTVAEITNTVTNEIKNAMDGQIDNKLSVVQKAIQGALSLGKQDISSTINLNNAIKQVISNSCNTNILNAIMTQTIAFQGATIIIGPRAILEADECRISQDMAITLISRAIVSQIISNIVNSKSVARAINDITSDQSATQKGLEDFFGDLLWPLVALAAVFLLSGGVVVKSGVDGLTNPKFLIVICVLGLVYFGLAYYMKWMPFQPPPPPPEHWGCQFDDATKFPTGYCKIYDNEKDGPFSSQMLCQNAIKDKKACQQYWGCARGLDSRFSGKCAQYNNPGDGPYYTQEECEAAIRNKADCLYTWDCNASQGKCTEIPSTLGTFDNEARCASQCKKEEQ